jgi:hypothetical protein
MLEERVARMRGVGSPAVYRDEGKCEDAKKWK